MSCERVRPLLRKRMEEAEANAANADTAGRTISEIRAWAAWNALSTLDATMKVQLHPDVAMEEWVKR